MANHKPTNGYKKDGTPNNPTGKGGFGDHPENRNPGGWRPEYTPSYQYRRFMNMDSDEGEPILLMVSFYLEGCSVYHVQHTDN